MSAPLGHWRATYTPGDWIVLSGPTSLVVLEPVSPQWASLVPALWTEVVESASLVDLATQLAGYRIDTMPSFAAFFWTEDGMRSLVRGAVRVLDPATGSVVADGAGIQTWNEVGLDGLEQVQVELPAATVDGSAPPMTLPLVVGAVRAASVLLDASARARITSPQVLADAAEPEDHQDEDRADENLQDENLQDEDLQDEHRQDEDPGSPDPDLQDADTIPEGEAEGEGEAGAESDEELDGPATELMTGPFDDDDLATSAIPAPGSASDGPPGVGMDPDLLDSIENGDTELMMAPVAAPEVDDEASTVSQDSMVLAVVCASGHSSPQSATQCRVCGAPIASQGPQLVARPALAVLRTGDGSVVEVDRAVLLGRAPSAQLSSARSPRLLTVSSPGHDISRTHVEVAPDGWQVVVTDLRSTNGTVLVRPGSGDRQQLPPGEAVTVPLQSLLELGDGVSVLIDFPQ